MDPLRPLRATPQGTDEIPERGRVTFPTQPLGALEKGDARSLHVADGSVLCEAVGQSRATDADRGRSLGEGRDHGVWVVAAGGQRSPVFPRASRDGESGGGDRKQGPHKSCAEVMRSRFAELSRGGCRAQSIAFMEPPPPRRRPML